MGNNSSPQIEKSPAEQTEIRKAKRERLIAEGLQAYPVDLTVSNNIPEIKAKYSYLSVGEETEDLAAIAGRVMFIRGAGKLAFAALQDGRGNRLQVMLSLAEIGAEKMKQFKELVDLGDHIWAQGRIISSKTGELSIFATDWKMASKALRPLPVLHKELSEDSRVRQRYLEFIANENTRNTVFMRAAMVASLRKTLSEDDFIEIETPMLQTLHGGAAARPFITHMNAFDIDLYLRIAPELFLKRAVVGGIDRVFEINRNFRNEGTDSSHSPEFAMLEAYQSYSDYNGIADLTKKLIQEACSSVFGSLKVTLADGSRYDFGGDWDQISLYDSLSAALKRKITPDTELAELISIAKDQLEGTEKKRLTNAKEMQKLTPGKLVELLWEHLVCSKLYKPTFVYDFPADTSPLVSAHRSKSGLVEKWDLYVRGFELATGYSELVDPVIQKERLVEQAKLAAKGDDEAMQMDLDFLEALEHGMPPTGGMGMGIDRLLMAFTGYGLRDTVTFPLVKPIPNKGL